MEHLEQSRRDLLASNHRLYDYIAAREAAKALDRLGDRLSGYDHGAANIAWVMAAEARERANRLLDPFTDATPTERSGGHL